MLFRMRRIVDCGTLTIGITFEPSEDPPCEAMLEHADLVEEFVREQYEETDKEAAVVAFEIVNRFRRVADVEVTDDCGDITSCSYEE